MPCMRPARARSGWRRSPEAPETDDPRTAGGRSRAARSGPSSWAAGVLEEMYPRAAEWTPLQATAEVARKAASHMQLRVLGSVDVVDGDCVIVVPGARRRSV